MKRTKVFIAVLAVLTLVSACADEEKARCQAQYDEFMTKGHSADDRTRSEAFAEIAGFLSGPCAKYLR